MICWYNMNDWTSVLYSSLDDLIRSQKKTRKRVSNADRKVFAHPESFCKKLIIGWRISGYFRKCLDTIQHIQTICKVSGWTGKFPDDLKSVRMNWKVSRWCKKCPENLKNVSGYSKKSLDDLKMYLDNLESFWMILKMSGLCKKKSGWAKNVPGWSGSLVNAPYGAYLDHGCA